jgi:tetratricopeptide (TPR) repeat protein
MKLFSRIIFIVMLTACLVSVLTIGSFAAETGKIPITTSSPEALQLFMQGRGLAESMQMQESRNYFEQAVQKDPNFALAYLYLAQAQSSAKGFMENLNKAVALVDKVSPAEKNWIMGQLAGANGLPMKQKEHWSKLVADYPGDEQAHGLMGLHYFGQQQWEQSVAEFNKAVALAPKYAQAYNQLGYAYRFLGKNAEAEKAFQQYIELIPNDPNPYDSYAELLMKMGRFDESIVQYRKALEQNPNFVSAQVGIALNLTLKGDHSGAQVQLQKLYDNARNDGERRTALFNMAVTYIDAGDLDEALKKVNEEFVIASKINDTANMANDAATMGMILLEMGKPDAAQAKFDEAINLIKASNLSAEMKEGNQRQYLYNAATVALEKGDLKAAHAKWEEFSRSAAAINSPTQIAQGHQLAGMIALKEKNFQKAIEELRLADTDFNPYNFYRMALAYQALGDNAKAKECFSKAAHFNGLDGLTYAFIRTKAQNLLKS